MSNVTPAKLAYNTFEPSSGKVGSSNPVIFLHGATVSKESFHDLPQIISDGTSRKVYALDARNHGDSEQIDFFNFDINTDDLFHFMDTMNIQKAALIGHSMGGITAIKAALRKPERIEMIFVEDIHTNKIPKERMIAASSYIEMWAESVRSVPKELNYTDALQHACDIFYEKLPPDITDLPPKEVFCKYSIPFGRAADGGYTLKLNTDAIIKAYRDPETLMSEPSGQYDGPAYFLYGTLSDFRVWEKEESIKKHFPKAELIKFEGASHNIHLEFPEQFTATVFQGFNH